VRHAIGTVRPPKAEPRKRLPRLRYEGVDAGRLGARSVGAPTEARTEAPLAGVPPAVAFLAMGWMDG